MRRGNSFLSLAIVAFAYLSFSHSALAGAWTQPEGRAQLITNLVAYQTTERFDVNGDRKPQPKYRKFELNPYLEYGLSDDWTVGASLFLHHLNDDTHRTTGLADSEFFARYQLYRDNDYALAIQPLVKLPSPQSRRASPPAIGSRYADFALNVIGGANFEHAERSHFVELDLGYRLRTGSPEDQIILNGTVGYRLTDRITLLPQFFQTIAAQTPDVTSVTLTPRDDYNLSKAQFSVVYQLDDKRFVQAGAFHHITGLNTGAGGGVILSLWSEL